MQVSAWNFIKKEALAQVFSCEFCEISKSTFYRTPAVAASVHVSFTAIFIAVFTKKGCLVAHSVDLSEIFFNVTSWKRYVTS